MEFLPVLAVQGPKRSLRAAHNHDLLYFDLIQVTKWSTMAANCICLFHFRPTVNLRTDSGAWDCALSGWPSPSVRV